MGILARDFLLLSPIKKADADSGEDSACWMGVLLIRAPPRSVCDANGRQNSKPMRRAHKTQVKKSSNSNTGECNTKSISNDEHEAKHVCAFFAVSPAGTSAAGNATMLTSTMRAPPRARWPQRAGLLTSGNNTEQSHNITTTSTSNGGQHKRASKQHRNGFTSSGSNKQFSETSADVARIKSNNERRGRR